MGEPAGAAYGPNPALRVVVSGPSTSKPQAGSYKVSVKLTNGGAQPLTLGPTSVLFAVSRDGVDFACPPGSSTTPAASGPSSLAAGQTITVERELPCALPVAGKYDVRAYLRFGGGNEPPQASELVATLPVEVPAGDVPNQHAYAPSPGLIVVVDAKPQTRPLTAEEAKKGLFAVFVDVTNTTKSAVELKNPRVVFTATRNGKPVKCSPDMEKTILVGPSVLEPGKTHRFTAPVQCDLTAEGQYELGGFVNFGHAGKTDASIGKLTLQVVNEPK
jgi:hypothetical protein